GSEKLANMMRDFCRNNCHAKKCAIGAWEKTALISRKLGSPKLIRRQMVDDPGQPKLGRWGGPRIKGQQGANMKRGSTSVDYILARLEREGLTDWIDEIRARRVSAFAAAVELGWAERPQTLHGENCNQASLRRRAVVDLKALIG